MYNLSTHNFSIVGHFPCFPCTIPHSLLCSATCGNQGKHSFSPELLGAANSSDFKRLNLQNDLSIKHVTSVKGKIRHSDITHDNDTLFYDNKLCS